MSNCDFTPWIIYQGTTFERLLTIKAPDPSNPTSTDFSTWLPVDLTGCVFYGYIRALATDQGAPVSAFQFTILDQTNPLTKGQVLVFIAASDTDVIPVKVSTTYVRQLTKYVFDIRRKLADGITIKPIVNDGIIIVDPSATHD